jgi:hypothetical protein
MRENDSLDEFMAATEDTAPRKRRKARRPKLKRDCVKRRAFRVLAWLADLDQSQRGQVLKLAAELSAA